MHCGTCGATIPRGRGVCSTCGDLAGAPPGIPGTAGAVGTGAAAQAIVGIGTCPRCDYQGQGVPYFSRGPHMAALIGLTLFTLPMAMGAGGIVLYALRHDHRICPRCGLGWGAGGTRAMLARGATPGIEPRSRQSQRDPRSQAFAGPSGGLPRAWSVILLVVGLALLTMGIVEAEAIAIVMGAMSGVGAVALHQVANRASEARRQALIASLQMPVLKLAADRRGRLTVTEVAAELNWSIQRAEKVLNSLDDGWRVSSEITDDGVIVYEFRELLLGPPRSAGEASA